MYRRIYGMSFVMLFAIAANSQASTLIEPGVYTLSNHPGGGARPPLYGFRLDELYNATADHDVFTFDFDHAQSNMLMTFDGSSLVIEGESWGGLDTGTEYDAAYAGLWDISFTYSAVVGVPGDDDLIVYTPNAPNTGTITRLSNNDTISLFDYPGDHDYTFRLGNEDDDLGHRSFDGISGWGWVNHGVSNVHVEASDWIFTAHAVPEPATIALLLAGAVSFAYRKRRSLRR